MKLSYMRFMIGLLLLGVGGAKAVEADKSSPVTPPPPAVPSNYFTSQENSSPLHSHDVANREDKSTSIVPPAPIMPVSSVPVPTPAAPIMPAPFVPTSIPADLPRMSASPVSAPADDKDASTGIHGAHITTGIDFKSEEKDQHLSLQGVDTSHVKQVNGNWLEKKHYWQEIEGIVDQIKDKIASIAQQRVSFFTMRTEVDKELTTFYQHVGLDQGPLQDMIHYSLEIMEKEKEQKGFLNRKERAFYDKVQSKQRIFEQLKEDVKAIGTLDTKIDEALEVVLKQINACSEYEGEVWNIYKTVGYELSEKEAEQHYLNAQAFLKDVENIQLYLSGSFNTYFQELAQSVQTHTQSIVMQLDGLEKEGINLKKEATIFEAHEEQSEAQHNASHGVSSVQVQKNHSDHEMTHKVAVKKEVHANFVFRFFSSLLNSFKAMWHSIKGIFIKEPAIKAKAPTAHHQETVVHSATSSEVSSDSHTLHHPESTSSHEIPKITVSEEWKEELKYDAQRFDQEMESLKQAIKADVHEMTEIHKK